MYQPGGATVRSAGTAAFNVVPATTKGRSTRRCVLLKECVVSPGAIKLAVAISGACGVLIATASP